MPLLFTLIRNATSLYWAAIILLLTAGGCQTSIRLPILEPLSREQAITQYNRNAMSVPSFQALIARWEIHYTRDGKKSTHKDSSGKIFFQRAATDWPEQFYLQADTTLARRALVIACNREKVWMFSEPASQGVWSERTRINPNCVNQKLHHPDLLLELIGLKPLPDALRPNESPDYHIHAETFSLHYLQKSSTGLVAERDIVFDRHTNRPGSISLYNSSGRLMVSAQLDNYQSLGPAMIPGDITLTYPQDGSYLKLKLRKLKPKTLDLSPLFTRSLSQLKKLKEVQHLDFNCDNDSTNPSSEIR